MDAHALAHRTGEMGWDRGKYTAKNALV